MFPQSIKHSCNAYVLFLIQRSPDAFTEDSITLSMNPQCVSRLGHAETSQKKCECAQVTLLTSLSLILMLLRVLRIFPQKLVSIPVPLVFQAMQGTIRNQGEQEGSEAHISDAHPPSLPTPRINVIDCGMSNA